MVSYDNVPHFEAKVHIGSMMWDHTKNDLFKVGGAGGFHTTIFHSSKELFAGKNIIQDRIRNENFQQQFCSNTSLF